MATPPPLIRSSKAFSVEIPEGSNSAKARRSDVVGSDELSISAKKPNFKTSDAALLPEMHHEPASELTERSVQHADALSLEDLLAKEESGLHAPNMAHEESRQSSNIQNVGADALRDREIDLPPTDPIEKNLQHVADSTHKDNLQALPNGSLKENLQVVNEDAIQDNLQALPSGSLKDNLQSVSNDAIEDNLQNVAQDPLEHRDAEIDKEHLKDNYATDSSDRPHSNAHGLPSDVLKDNIVGEANSPLQNRQASVAKDSPEDNLQGLSSGTLKSNQQDVDNPAIVHNNTGLPSEALENRTAETDKKHVQDAMVALPDTEQLLKHGPSPGVVTKTGQSTSEIQQPKISKPTVPSQPKVTAKALSPAGIAQLQAARSEQARKTEEFHGRVEALKKTVSGINHLLDELEEKKPEKKT